LPEAVSGQEPIAVTEMKGQCAGIGNSDDCAQAIERRQVPLSHGRVRRDSTGLHLRLTSGTTLSVPDDTVDTAGAWPTWFHYIGISSALGYYVLWAQHVEGAAIRLVNARTGWSVLIPDLPVVSPDRGRFVTTATTFERGDPERLQVWRVEADTLRREWGFVPNYWVPEKVRWLSNRSFEFVHTRLEPTTAVREAVDTAEIDSGGHWVTRLGP